VKTYLHLLRHPRFASLCLGQAVSLLGDALFPILVVVAAAQAGTPADTIGAVFAARFVALGGVVLFSGALLDRVDPVRAAVVADSIRVVVLAGLAVLWNGDLNALVLGAALLIGACEAVSEPALLVVAPRILPEGGDEERVTAAYGLLEGMRSTAAVAGPVLAAALVTALSPSWGAAAAAIAFTVSAAATRWAAARVVGRSRRDTADGDNQDGPEEPLLKSSVQGLMVLWRIRWIRVVESLAVVHVLLAVGPWMVAMPVAVLAGEGSASVYALLLSAFAAGAVAGALLGGRIRGPARGGISLVLLAAFGVTALAPAVIDSLPVLIALFVLGGAGQQAFDVVKMAAIRSEVPERLHGRAFSADFFFSFAALPLGQVVGAFALHFVEARQILLWSGVLVIVTTCVPLLLSADTRRFASAADAVAPAAPEYSDASA